MPNKKDNLNISEKGWKTVIDFTEIDKDGVSAKEVLQALRRIEE